MWSLDVSPLRAPNTDFLGRLRRNTVPLGRFFYVAYRRAFQIVRHPRVVAALWAGLFGAVTAALTAVIVGLALGRTWSALAGLTVAIFPSQIVWSSVVLRESMVWAGLAGAAVGISIFSRAKRWRSLAGATLLVGVCLLSSRIPSLLGVPASGVGNRQWPFGCSARPARFRRGPCALYCACSSHWPQGSVLRATATFVHHGQQLGYERSVLAEGAKSAFVHPKVVAAPAPRGSPRRTGG